jgi:hypothetical protein
MSGRLPEACTLSRQIAFLFSEVRRLARLENWDYVSHLPYGWQVCSSD